MSRDLTTKLEHLRGAFDESFSLPADARTEDMEHFLAIRVGKAPYAMRIAELAGVEAGKKITRLPTAVDALIGIAGIHGRLVPVYHLAPLIGVAPEEEEPVWLAVCQPQEPVAFAFSELERHLRLPENEFRQNAEDGRKCIRGALRLGSEVRHVIDVPALVRAVRHQTELEALKRGK